jgi:curli production assembly/transport component CsgF
MKKTLTTFGLLLSVAITNATASEMVFQFSNPSFSGIGYSSHALTIYSQELSRKLAIAAEKKADALKAEQDAKNTTMAKFIANLESRVYNELARQITEKLFEGQGTQASGTFAFNGGTITYVKNGNLIEITINDANGSVTTMTVPIGDFGWLQP